MSRYDVMSEYFSEVTILGKPALFTPLRIDRNTVPNGYHLYEVRHDDDNGGNEIEIARSIIVNHWGSLITQNEIVLPLDGYLNIEPNDLKYDTGECRSMESFIAKYPVVLSEIDPRLYEQERQRYCREWEQTIAAATEALASEFNGLLSHMIDRLQPNPDGTRKIFRDSLVENFRDFLEKFQPRNISDSENLAALARECQSIMATLDSNAAAQQLRQSESTREVIANGMSRVRDSLNSAITTITTTPVRHIRPITPEELSRCA